MTFEDFAFACDCNATSLKAWEHAQDCTAIRCWYKADNAMAALLTRALDNEKRAERYRAVLEEAVGLLQDVE